MSGTPDGSMLDADHAEDGALIARLGRLADVPVPAAVAAEHLGAIDRQAAARRRRRRAALAGVVGAGLLLGSTSLAAAGVLPSPAQTAMHRTLEHIGIDVPHARRANAPRRAGSDEGAATPAPVIDDGPRRDGRERATDGAPGRRAANGGSDGARDGNRTFRSTATTDVPPVGRPSRSPAPDPAAPDPAAPRTSPDPAAPDPGGGRDRSEPPTSAAPPPARPASVAPRAAEA